MVCGISGEKNLIIEYIHYCYEAITTAKIKILPSVSKTERCIYFNKEQLPKSQGRNYSTVGAVSGIIFF